MIILANKGYPLFTFTYNFWDVIKTLQNIAKQGGTTGQRENPILGSKNAGFTTKNEVLHEWARKDSNLRPMDYESTALTN